MSSQHETGRLKKRKIEQPQISKIKSQVQVTHVPVTRDLVSLPDSVCGDNVDSDGEDLIIEEDTSTAIPAKKFFCCYCQKQYKNSQEIYQHNTTRKHKKNIFNSQTKFKVGAEIITNKAYGILMSEKEWLTDSVSILNF